MSVRLFQFTHHRNLGLQTKLRTRYNMRASNILIVISTLLATALAALLEQAAELSKHGFDPTAKVTTYSGDKRKGGHRSYAQPTDIFVRKLENGKSLVCVRYFPKGQDTCAKVPFAVRLCV